MPILTLAALLLTPGQAKSDYNAAQDELPAHSRPFPHRQGTPTEIQPEKLKYLGGRRYQRPDGEIITAPGDID